jgi:hypothetical protein
MTYPNKDKSLLNGKMVDENCNNCIQDKIKIFIVRLLI